MDHNFPASVQRLYPFVFADGTAIGWRWRQCELACTAILAACEATAGERRTWRIP